MSASTVRAVCVFCGSRSGQRQAYTDAAAAIGPAFAARNLQLVFGGGKVGLMGAIADSCLAAGVYVVGVQPHFLFEREVMHERVQEPILTQTMHERKQIMYDRSDAFLVLPGGIGTLDELFEVFTWAQLGLHPKPIGIWDVAGYWGQLVTFLDHMVTEGFLSPRTRDLLLVDTSLDNLLDRMAAYVPPTQEQWATPAQR